MDSTYLEGFDHGPDPVTLVAHEPDTGMTAFWVATNEHTDPSPSFAAVAERVAGIR